MPLPRDVFTLPLLSPVATPLPNPALAITPRTPFAPPVPLPEPGPVGKSNEPAWAMLTGRLLFSRAGTPLGSPKPPVCTFLGASAIVGRAELPVENTWVFTNCFGITGALGGRVTGLMAAISTFGATGTSSGAVFGRTMGG